MTRVFAGGCVWWRRPPHSSLEFRLSVLVSRSPRCRASGWSTPVLRHTWRSWCQGSTDARCPLGPSSERSSGGQEGHRRFLTETWLPSGRPGSLKTDLRRGEGKGSGTLSFEKSGWFPWQVPFHFLLTRSAPWGWGAEPPAWLCPGDRPLRTGQIRIPRLVFEMPSAPRCRAAGMWTGYPLLLTTPFATSPAGPSAVGSLLLTLPCPLPQPAVPVPARNQAAVWAPRCEGAGSGLDAEACRTGSGSEGDRVQTQAPGNELWFSR